MVNHGRTAGYLQPREEEHPNSLEPLSPIPMPPHLSWPISKCTQSTILIEQRTSHQLASCLYCVLGIPSIYGKERHNLGRDEIALNPLTWPTCKVSSTSSLFIGIWLYYYTRAALPGCFNSPADPTRALIVSSYILHYPLASYTSPLQPLLTELPTRIFPGYPSKNVSMVSSYFRVRYGDTRNTSSGMSYATSPSSFF